MNGDHARRRVGPIYLHFSQYEIVSAYLNAINLRIVIISDFVRRLRGRVDINRIRFIYSNRVKRASVHIGARFHLSFTSLFNYCRSGTVHHAQTMGDDEDHVFWGLCEFRVKEVRVVRAVRQLYAPDANVS